VGAGRGPAPANLEKCMTVFTVLFVALLGVGDARADGRSVCATDICFPNAVSECVAAAPPLRQPVGFSSFQTRGATGV